MFTLATAESAFLQFSILQCVHVNTISLYSLYCTDWCCTIWCHWRRRYLTRCPHFIYTHHSLKYVWISYVCVHHLQTSLNSYSVLYTYSYKNIIVTSNSISYVYYRWVRLLTTPFSFSQELVDRGLWPSRNLRSVQKWPTLNLTVKLKRLTWSIWQLTLTMWTPKLYNWDWVLLSKVMLKLFSLPKAQK